MTSQSKPHCRIEGAYQQLLARLDHSPVLSKTSDVIIISCERFNWYQTDIIRQVCYEYGLTMDLSVNEKIIHACVNITLQARVSPEYQPVNAGEFQHQLIV